MNDIDTLINNLNNMCLLFAFLCNTCVYIYYSQISIFRLAVCFVISSPDLIFLVRSVDELCARCACDMIRFI